MKDLMGKCFAKECFEYDYVMTAEETLKLSHEETKELSKRARISPVVVIREGDVAVIIDKTAYVLEPCNDLN